MRVEKLSSAPGGVEEEAALVAGEGGKAWLLPLNGVDQPTYSFFHRTMLTGGSVIPWDGSSFGAAQAFPAVDAGENREDFLFSVTGELLLLVYSRYEEFSLLGLRRWDGGAWRSVELSGAEALALKSDRFDVSFCRDAKDADAVYLVASPNRDRGAGLVGKLSFKDGKGKAEKLMTVDLGVLRMPDASMLMAAAKNVNFKGPAIYCTVGVHGCGVRWEADQLLKLNLDSGVSEAVSVSGKGPGYSFGPLHSGVVEGSWIILGGSHMGFQSSTADPGVWRLSLSGSPAWDSAALGAFPKELQDEDMFASAQGPDGAFLLFHPKHGLHRLTV